MFLSRHKAPFFSLPFAVLYPLRWTSFWGVGQSTSTLTPTCTPTPSIKSLRVVAVPNVSRNGQPVQFNIEITTSTRWRLTLYTLLGEQVFQVSSQGNAGLNTFSWGVQNQLGQEVASGLYVYIVETNEGSGLELHRGKIVVFH